MKKLISYLLILSMLFIGCAPTIQKRNFIVKFDKTEHYNIDLSTIPKPNMIKPIFVDKDFKETSLDNAEYVLLVPKEYNKIAALLKLCKMYKNIIKEQEVLINTDIDTINALKEYIALEQAKSEEYKELWANSEEAYQKERFYHKVDNAINRGTFLTIIIGVIIAIIAL